MVALFAIAGVTNKMKLQINGTDVADFKYVDPHYTAVTSYYHTVGSKPITSILTTSPGPTSNVQADLEAQTYISTLSATGENDKFFLYPFCLDTSKVQPTGSLNFSRLDSARLVNDTANSRRRYLRRQLQRPPYRKWYGWFDVFQLSNLIYPFIINVLAINFSRSICLCYNV
jgi:hypothetical protein